MWWKVLKLAVLSKASYKSSIFPCFYTVHFLSFWLAAQYLFLRMRRKMSCPQSKLFSPHVLNLCFWESQSQSTMFSTHDRPSCPISEASNRLRLFNNLLLLQIFEIFMNCWIIRSAGELGHFKTCQFHDFGPQQVNIQLWSSSSRKAVIFFCSYESCAAVIGVEV